MSRPNPSSYTTVLAVVGLSTWVSMLAYAGPLGNVVTLTRALRTSATGSAWVLASMSIGLAVTLLAAGVIADEIGHRRVFVLGALLFAAANLVCGLTDSVTVFVLARLVAGAGATGMIATGLGLVAAASEHDTHRRTTATWWSVAMGAGIALGPIGTGLLDRIDGWHLFYLGLALGGALLGLAAARLRLPAAPRRSGQHLDLLGFALLTGSLATGVTAIVGFRTGAGPGTIALLVAALLLTVALVVSQRRGRSTLIDPALFRHRGFLAATLAGFGTGFGVIAAMSYACSHLVLGLGMSTLAAACLLAAWSGTSAVAALVVARVAANLPGPAQLAGGLTGTAAGLLLLIPATSPLGMLPGLLLAGAASGVLNAGLARQAVATVPAERAAMGSGANNTARYLGAALGVTLAATLVGHAPTLGIGWQRVTLVTGVAAALSALGVLLLSRAHRQAADPQPALAKGDR
ncbi:MFS transporter [Enemella evansiae]|uniref:MFS transporter n=1 Tax=Enemella evansiae TaxID=2016499 RepID=UPI000B95F831|nr:MFS transporter [Enemella evansiae]OYO06958.1 MFS transporter [Enemella evansiae]